MGTPAEEGDGWELDSVDPQDGREPEAEAPSTDGGDVDHAEEGVFDCTKLCIEDSQCLDDIFCNGAEYCNLSYVDPVTGEGCCEVVMPCTSPPDVCKESSCVEEVEGCVEDPLDADDDGFAASSATNDLGEQVPCPGNDCNDRSYATHPGATEICDMADNDCDLAADEDAWKAAGDPLMLSGASTAVGDADLAVIPAGWLVAWTDTLAAPGVLVARVSAGDTTPPAPKSLGGVSGAVEVEVVATSPGTPFVFWTENRKTIRAAKLSEASGYDVETTLVVHEETESFSEVSDLDAALEQDGLHAAVFFRAQPHGNSEIYMVRLGLDPFDAAGVEPLRRVSQAIGFSGYPSAAAAADGYVVAWEDERDGNKEIYVQRLPASGDDAGIPGRITAAPGDSSLPSIVQAGDGYWVAWMDESGGPFNVMAAELTASAAPESYPVAVSEPGEPRVYPVAASDMRDPGALDQAYILYVSATLDEQKLFLTGAGKGASALPEGVQLRTTSRTIIDPGLSGGPDAMAVIWIEWEYTQSSLFFLGLTCPPAP